MSVIKTRKLLFCVNKSIINGSNSLASWNLWECNYTFHLVCHFFFHVSLQCNSSDQRSLTYMFPNRLLSLTNNPTQVMNGRAWQVQFSCTCNPPARAVLPQYIHHSRFYVCKSSLSGRYACSSIFLSFCGKNRKSACRSHPITFGGVGLFFFLFDNK